ncbi:MAG: hypothetical protein R3A45_06345 [Bdellovibrionota bacterium]
MIPIAIIGQVRSYIEKYEDFRIQYIDLLDWETFAPRRSIENKSILALAYYSWPNAINR